MPAMEDDELAAFRRAPDEWHRLKEEQQGQLMRDCRWHQCGGVLLHLHCALTCMEMCNVLRSLAAQAFLNLVHRDVLAVQKSLPTIVGASKSTVRALTLKSYLLFCCRYLISSGHAHFFMGLF